MCQVMDLNDNQANVAFTFAKDRCVSKTIAYHAIQAIQAIQATAGWWMSHDWPNKIAFSVYGRHR